MTEMKRVRVALTGKTEAQWSRKSGRGGEEVIWKWHWGVRRWVLPLCQELGSVWDLSPLRS